MLADPRAGVRSAASALLVLALLIAGCGEEEPSRDKAPAGGSQGQEPASGERSGAKARAAPGECRQVEAPEPKPEGGQEKPGRKLDRSKRYEVVLQTSCGSFTIRLDVSAAPHAAASFAALARGNFFDGTYFHRIIPGFVAQGGDPTGTGTGGPGYSTRDKPPSGTRYPKGTVAMAKTGDEPPGTAGSQFFVVTADDAGLPPEYSVIGRVTAGKEVVARIGALGDPNTELPTQPVVIDDVAVEVT